MDGRVAHRPRFARECNADHDRHAMGKNRERVRFSPRPGRRGSPGEGRTCRTRRAARRLSRLLRSEISSCGGAGASWRGAGTRAFRSEIARRHAGGPRLSRPYPRRPRRGAAGRSASGAGRRDVGPYHRSQPRSRPSHVPAVVLAAEPCAPSRNRVGNAPLRGLGPARRTSKALSAGAGNVFPFASLGVGREIGIGCPEKSGYRVLKTPPCAPRAFRL